MRNLQGAGHREISTDPTRRDPGVSLDTFELAPLGVIVRLNR